MTTAVLATYGTYHPHHQRLKKLGCTPCECDVFGKIAGLIHRLDRAFVHLKDFAEELGYCRGAISRAVTSLERKKLVRRTGKKAFGFFHYVEILPLADDGEQPAPMAPLTKKSTIVDQDVNAHCPGDQLQEKKTNEVKKQQHEIVCSEKIVDPEKLNLIDALRGYGLGKNSAKALITRFGLERVKYQVEHLEDVLKRGGNVANPAAWLTKAIHKRYQKPKDLVITQPTIENDQRQKAQHLLQQAQQEYRLENLDHAQALAQKSIELFELPQAKELTAEIAQRFERQKAREEVLKAIPQEVFARALQQKREEQRTILMKLGIKKLGTVGEKAAYEMAVSELCQQQR